jgi:transposase
MPLNRLSKRFDRAGVPMARSTLTDLFHRVAQLGRPLYLRLLAQVAETEYVNADETSQPVMDVDKCRKGFIWTFIAGPIVAYVFSATRSGQTAVRVLGQSTGVLQVDGYTGYNHVTEPKKRVRAGCLAHARRYFHKARDACPAEATYVLELVRKLYRVESEAARRGITGTPEHLALRKLRSKPLMDEWKPWLQALKPQHGPKSPMGKAVRYALNQWDSLTRFLDDPKIRLDNNVSESALRIVALGRDNFRWVGNDQAGENLAVLQTLVSTCVACGVNPEDYLADVLLRVDTHPASAIDELLPMNWAPAN